MGVYDSTWLYMAVWLYMIEMAATQRLLKVHADLHACIFDLALNAAATERLLKVHAHLKVHADLHACIFDSTIRTQFPGDVVKWLGVMLA